MTLIQDKYGCIKSRQHISSLWMDTEDLTQLCDYPLLTKEEEVSLGRKIQKGCLESRNKLVQHNVRLVKSLVERFATSAFPLPDLISIGIMGLMEAADRFNPDKYDVKFSTYASRCIFSSVFTHFDRHKRKASFLLTNVPLHIDDLEPEDERENFQMDPERKEKVEKITKALALLSPKEQYFLKATYGIEPFKTAITMKQLGEIEGLSRQRVHQIIKLARERLSAIIGEF